MSAALASLVSHWAAIYANSAALRTVIGFLHVGGLVVSGGRAIVMDRETILAFRRGDADRADAIHDLHASHPLVIGGLIVVSISGLLLFASDFDNYLVSTTFWIKMACILLLSLNGLRMMRATSAAERQASAWPVLRQTAIASLVLWTATTLLGAALPNVG